MEGKTPAVGLDDVGKGGWNGLTSLGASVGKSIGTQEDVREEREASSRETPLVEDGENCNKAHAGHGEDGRNTRIDNNRDELVQEHYLALIEGQNPLSGLLSNNAVAKACDALKSRDQALIGQMTSFFKEELRQQVRVLQRQLATCKENANLLQSTNKGLVASLKRRDASLEEERRLYLQQLLIIKEMHLSTLSTNRDPIDLRNLRAKALQQVSANLSETALAVLSKIGVEAPDIPKGAGAGASAATDIEDDSMERRNSLANTVEGRQLHQGMTHEQQILLQQKLQHMMEKNEKLNIELQTRKDFLRNVQKERDELKESLKTTSRELHEEIASLKSQIEPISAGSASHVTQTNAHATELAEALAEAQNHILTQNETLSNVKSELRDTQRSMAKLEKENTSLKEVCDKLNAQLVESLHQARSNLASAKQAQSEKQEDAPNEAQPLTNKKSPTNLMMSKKSSSRAKVTSKSSFISSESQSFQASFEKEKFNSMKQSLPMETAKDGPVLVSLEDQATDAEAASDAISIQDFTTRVTEQIVARKQQKKELKRHASLPMVNGVPEQEQNGVAKGNKILSVPSIEDSAKVEKEPYELSLASPPRAFDSEDNLAENEAAGVYQMTPRRPAKPRISMGRRRRASCASPKRTSSMCSVESSVDAAELRVHPKGMMKSIGVEAKLGKWMTDDEFKIWKEHQKTIDADLERTCNTVCKLEQELDQAVEECNSAWETAERLEREKMDVLLALHNQEKELTSVSDELSVTKKALALAGPPSTTSKSGHGRSMQKSASHQPQGGPARFLRSSKSSNSLLEMVESDQGTNVIDVENPHKSVDSGHAKIKLQTTIRRLSRTGSSQQLLGKQSTNKASLQQVIGGLQDLSSNGNRQKSRWSILLQKNAKSNMIVSKMREFKRTALANRSTKLQTDLNRATNLERVVRQLRHELVAARLSLDSLSNKPSDEAKVQIIRRLLENEENLVQDNDAEEAYATSQYPSMLSLGLDLLTRQCATDTSLSAVAVENYKVMLSMMESGLHASITSTRTSLELSPVLMQVLQALDRLAVAGHAWRELRLFRARTRWQLFVAQLTLDRCILRRDYIVNHLASKNHEHRLLKILHSMCYREQSMMSKLERQLGKFVQQGIILRRLMVQFCAEVSIKAGVCTETSKGPMMDMLTKHAEPPDAEVLRKAQENLERSFLERAQASETKKRAARPEC